MLRVRGKLIHPHRETILSSTRPRMVERSSERAISMSEVEIITLAGQLGV